MSLQTQNQNLNQQDQKVHYVLPMTTNYTESYDHYGRCILDQNIQSTFFQIVLKNLPQNYYGADIGSFDGKLGNDLMKVKKGKIISVDPFPTNNQVIESTGQDFLKKHQRAFDCIIFKFCLHFFDNFEEFYQDLSRALKPNGKIFVLSLSPNTKLPWNDKIEKGFIKSCKNYENSFPDHNVEQRIIRNTRKAKTQIFKSFLLSRGFSNLLQHSQEEIKQCTQSLPKSEEVDLKWQYKIIVAKSKRN